MGTHILSSHKEMCFLWRKEEKRQAAEASAPVFSPRIYLKSRLQRKQFLHFLRKSRRLDDNPAPNGVVFASYGAHHKSHARPFEYIKGQSLDTGGHRYRGNGKGSKGLSFDLGTLLSHHVLGSECVKKA